MLTEGFFWRLPLLVNNLHLNNRKTLRSSLFWSSSLDIDRMAWLVPWEKKPWFCREGTPPIMDIAMTECLFDNFVIHKKINSHDIKHMQAISHGLSTILYHVCQGRCIWERTWHYYTFKNAHSTLLLSNLLLPAIFKNRAHMITYQGHSSGRQRAKRYNSFSAKTGRVRPALLFNVLGVNKAYYL